MEIKSHRATYCDKLIILMEHYRHPVFKSADESSMVLLVTVPMSQLPFNVRHEGHIRNLHTNILHALLLHRLRDLNTKPFVAKKKKDITFWKIENSHRFAVFSFFYRTWNLLNIEKECNTYVNIVAITGKKFVLLAKK